MAIVKGIREKVHLPLYDSIFVEPKKQLRDVERSSTLKLFVNVQNKTRLETNLQSASLLPHYNTFEARAMRVVISDLPPEFPGEDDDSKALGGEDEAFQDFEVTNDNGDTLDQNGAVSNAGSPAVTADLEYDLEALNDMLREARASEDQEVTVNVDDEEVTIYNGDNELDPVPQLLIDNGQIAISIGDLEAMMLGLREKSPPLEQIRSNDGAGNLVSKFIYNTVTTFYVGEKVMIEMPTFFFPAGSGTCSFNGKGINHGEPVGSPGTELEFAL